jgi:broad specificity phosphatase PhoE
MSLRERAFSAWEGKYDQEYMQELTRRCEAGEAWDGERWRRDVLLVL